MGTLGEKLRRENLRLGHGYFCCVFFCLAATLMLLPASLHAAEGDEPCLVCHNPDSSPAVHGIFETAHGDVSCTSCHGDTGNHTRNPALQMPAVTFGPKHFASADAQTGACLNCHQDALAHWEGSPHDNGELTCSACHGGHAAAQPVLVAATQGETCAGCHAPAEHPIALDTSAGPVVCTSCHEPHGTGADKALALPTGSGAANETCLTCHNPASSPEVHGIFQTAHGNLNCTSCHGGAGNHPRSPANELPAVTFGPKHFASADAQTGACLNCHQDALAHWEGSPHDNGELTCSACHGGHAAAQPVLVAATQGETCAGCHAPAEHPIPLDTSAGPAVCTNCHAPHGTGAAKALALPTGGDADSQTCLTCHNTVSSPEVHGIFETAHASLSCISCHGAPGNHPRSPRNEKPAVTFGPEHFASAEARTGACLNCHEDALTHWEGSPHDNGLLTCNSCHGGHAAEQPVLAEATQAETCNSCHQTAHPGQFDSPTEPVVCTSCHAPHGSSNPSALEFTEEALASDQTCLTCHNPMRSPGVHGIFGSAHGIADDPRTPQAGDGCRSCHGDPGQHPMNPTASLPEVTFGPQHFADVDAQNDACLGCHQADAMHWDGGTHAVEDVVCSDCHDSHVRRQPVLERVTQAETCYECHQDVRAQVRLPSRHPIFEAKVICTDCHAPHGSLKRGELIGLSLNDTCLECHEDQRGPFLFEHQPVAEDCASCHVPHGAVHEPLLQTRGPFLCQECHAAEFHPSDLNSGGGLPGAMANPNLLGRNCLSCHPKVHGSNHPSGARLTR